MRRWGGDVGELTPGGLWARRLQARQYHLLKTQSLGVAFLDLRGAIVENIVTFLELPTSSGATEVMTRFGHYAPEFVLLLDEFTHLFINIFNLSIWTVFCCLGLFVGEVSD